eukprot:9503834-Pyramimonas_sp.AAC.1
MVVVLLQQHRDSVQWHPLVKLADAREALLDPTTTGLATASKVSLQSAAVTARPRSFGGGGEGVGAPTMGTVPAETSRPPAEEGDACIPNPPSD